MANLDVSVYQSILNALAEGVAWNELMRDEEGQVIDYKVLMVNDAFFRVADFDNSLEPVGGLATQLYGMDSDFIGQFEKTHRQMTAPVTSQYRSPRTHRWFRVTTTPFAGDHFVTSFSDISEQVLWEQQRDLDHRIESIGVMAGVLGHDLNNHIAGLSLSLELIASTCQEPRAKGGLLRSMRQLERVKSLAKQMMTFAQTPKPELVTVDLGKLLRELVADNLVSSNVAAEFEVAADLWSCDVDPGQMAQVFGNLTINALQAMKGSGTLKVTVRNLTQTAPALVPPGNYVHVDFADSGPGIPPEQLTRVFEPSFTSKPGGHGLGLASVYSIVKRHDGLVTVESPPGSGAQFQIWLPATDRPSTPRTNPPMMKGS